MGAKLDEYFKQAEKMGGMKAKLQLSLLAGMSFLTAKEAPDDPSIIQLFEDAIKELKKEFGG